MPSASALIALQERYLLNKLIGQGDNANVYRAMDMEQRQVVAVKRYDQRLRRDVRFVAHFRREARLACTFDHPHVHRTLSYGYADDAYYTVSPYARGGNIGPLLAVGRGPVPAETMRVFAEICAGLAYIHQRGLLHRNLKPANVLLHADGRAVVADVGLTHQVGSSDLTMTVATLGAITYFSPEHILGQALSPAFDIYAVGLMLYQACAGRLPFIEDSPLALARRQLRDAPPPPRTFNPEVSPDLEQVVLHCLEKSPAARYAGAYELAQALALCPESAGLPRWPAPVMEPPEDTDAGAAAARGDYVAVADRTEVSFVVAPSPAAHDGLMQSLQRNALCLLIGSDDDTL